MARIAALPIDEFYRLSSEENSSEYIINTYKDNPIFREAVAIASDELTVALRKNIADPKAVLALAKYFSRITSRCTPFGLFSYVGLGQATDINRPKAVLELDSVIKRARFDMLWLQNLIEKIAQNDDQLLDLPVQTSSFLLNQGNRFLITHHVEKYDHESSSIKKSPLTEAMFYYAKRPIQIRQLIELVIVDLPHLEKRKIIKVIKTLIRQQFLFLALSPQLTAVNPLKSLIDGVPANFKNQLKRFNEKIKKYSSVSLGQGLQLLDNIKNEMYAFASSRSCLQVDAKIVNADLTLPQKLLSEVAEGVEVLWKIRSHGPSAILTDYFNRFVEKFGTYRLVPLKEVIDETRGLGYPDFDSKVTAPANGLNHRVKSWTQDLLFDAIRDHKQEIVLTKQHLDTLIDNKDLTKAPPSIDVFFEVASSTTDDISEGHYSILLTSFKQQGSSTLGRFLDMFDGDLESKVRKLLAKEELLDSELEFVECSYCPAVARAQNIATSPNLREKLIDLNPGGMSNLELDDIFIGVQDNKRLYVTSKTGEVEYYVTANNVLSLNITPPILRLLFEISFAKFQTCKPWMWEEMATVPFLPRVRYKNVIISPAKWHMSLARLKIALKTSKKDVIKRLKAYVENHDIPRYVYICKGDNKLLIDIQNDLHIEILSKELMSSDIVLLIEKYGQTSGDWAESELGKHSVEFALTLIKNKNYASNKPFLASSQYLETSIKDRVLLPGSDWLFVKIYLPLCNNKRFLLDYLSPFAKYLLEQHCIKRWFYICYADEKPHIRLRFNGSPQILQNKVIPQIQKLTYDLLEQGVIQEAVLCPYERELERYGGMGLMMQMEKLFCVDSNIIIELLKLEKDLDLPIYVIASFSIMNMLQQLKLSDTEQSRFFKLQNLNKAGLAGIRNWRQKLMNGPPEILLTTLEQREKPFSEIGVILKSKEQTGSLRPSRFSLISSLVHMHCNRLMGIDAKAELQARSYAAFTIEKKLLLAKRCC